MDSHVIYASEAILPPKAPYRKFWFRDQGLVPVRGDGHVHMEPIATGCQIVPVYVLQTALVASIKQSLMIFYLSIH